MLKRIQIKPLPIGILCLLQEIRYLPGEQNICHMEAAKDTIGAGMLCVGGARADFTGEVTLYL